jgi:hypothetical protein
MGITIQPHNDEHFHLRHQALWFIVLLIVMLLLLSKNVATTLDGRSTMDDRRWTIDDGRSTMDDRRWTMDDQCVIEYSRMLIPIA